MNASIFSLPAAAQVPLSSPAASKDPAASAVSGTEVSFGCVLDGTTVGAQAQNIASSSRETVSFVGIPVVSVCTGTAIDSGSPVPAASQDGPIAQPVDETQAEGASKPDARSSSSSQRRPSTDLPAVLGSRSIKHAKCALQPQDGQVDQQQCAVPESPVSTKASKCTSSVDKGDTLPSPQEHPEQSMSLIAPGMAVAAAHASLSVPVHSMPGQTRISSSTTENGIGDTNGAVITSSDDSSSITEAQSPRIVQGARSQLDASSNRLENPSVQLPVRSISRSSNTKVVSELAPAAQGGPQVALSEPSTPDHGLRKGIVHPGACTQNDALPMPPEKVKVAGPTTPESKVSKSASHNEGAHKQSVLTQAEGELATSDTASPQVTFAFVGQKSHFDNAVDHVASSSGGATQASHSPKVNTRAGGGGHPTELVAIPTDVSNDLIRSSGHATPLRNAEVPSSLQFSSLPNLAPGVNGGEIPAASSAGLEVTGNFPLPAEGDVEAVPGALQAAPKVSSSMPSGLAQHRPFSSNDSQAAVEMPPRPGVGAEAHIMPEASQAFLHASSRSMVMRRYGMISAAAGTEPGAAAIASPSGPVSASIAGGTAAAETSMVGATSSASVSVTQLNTAATTPTAQGAASATFGKVANEPSTSKGKGASGTPATVEFSASPSKQASGRSLSVDEKNRQHTAEDVEAGGAGSAGIGNAKSHANMSTAFQVAAFAEPTTAQPTAADWLTEGLARLGAASQGARHDDVRQSSQAGQLVERVEKAVESLQSHAGKVVRFEVGGPNDERLAVSMQLRDGVLQTVFQTSSQELRDVLARDWSSSVSGGLQGENSLKVAEPVFNGGGRNDFSGTGADSRQRQQQEAARGQEVPAEASLFGLSRRSAASPAAHAEPSAQAPARQVHSTRGLNAIA